MRPDSSIQWSGYPALLVAGAFSVGILGHASLVPAQPVVWMGATLLGMGLFFAAEWWDQSRLVTLGPVARLAAVVFVALCAGGLRHSVYQAKGPRALSIIAAEAEEPLTMEGVVRGAPEQMREATRFSLDVDRLYGESDTASVTGKARVTLRASPWADDVGPFPDIHQGDVVRLTGDLRRPPGLRNPGGFDYRAYLARRGICCTVYVSEPADIDVRGARRTGVGTLVVAAREHIRQQLRRFIPSDGGRAVLRALLLGDRSRITDEQRARFSETGLMHLLAVSGLHVFLVGMVLYLLLRPLLMRFRLRWRTVEVARAALTIVALGFYMLLTGARASVVRATIMATLLIGSVLFQRSAHPLNTLGVAALVLLAVRPSALFDVGFQLSMAAVGAIVTLNPRFSDLFPEKYRSSEIAQWLVSSVTVSAAAILGTAPVLLYHFGWVSGAGLVLNIFGIPFTGLALSASIVAVATGSAWTVAGAAFGSAADLFVRGLLATSRYGAEWMPWAGLRMTVPEPWILAAVVAGLVAGAQWPRPRNRWRCIIFALALAVVSMWGDTLGRGARPTLDVVFFDVGQGNATLMTTPRGQRVLVDTGPRSPTGAEVTFSVLPYLDRHGVRSVDAVVITHPDEDHLGGLPALLEEINVGRVVHSGETADTELFAEVRRRLGEQNVPERAVERGDTIDIGGDIRVQVLGPPSQPEERGITSRNGASVVLHVAYGGIDMLLPGDIEAIAERDLVRVYGRQLSSRVVAVPHHGSSTSSTPAFVSAVAGKRNQGLAVVSVGAGDQYSMPSSHVLERWREAGMTVRSTARRGAVVMRSDGRRLWLVDWQ